MEYLDNEDKILSSTNDSLILTNQRIKLTNSKWGESYSIIIFLENISSIEKKYISHIWLIVLGVISALIGIYLGNDYTGKLGIVGAIFFALWFFSRQHVLSISSNGGSSLNYSLVGMSENDIDEFLHQISKAKQTRVNELYKFLYK